MKSILLAVTAMILTCTSATAQTVTKLDLEPGYGGITVGTYVRDVRKLFVKDSITHHDVWDTTDVRIKEAEQIFLVDLKQPGLDTFHGRKVERVEVYTSPRHNNAIEQPSDSDAQVIDYIKIYLQQEHYDEGAFQDLVGVFYVDYGNYSEDFDYPEKGDMLYTWSGQYFGFRLSNYYGEKTLNRKYDLAVYYRY